MCLKDFKGVIPAFITPFDKDGNYSAKCAKEMIDWQISKGIGGYYFLGSNGYGPAMDSVDRMKALESMVEIVDGRVPVVAHIAAVSGKESVAMAIGYDSKAKGALGCWIVLGEQKQDDEYNWHLVDVQCFKVDGEKIKADTFYKLKDGQPIEAEE